MTKMDKLMGMPKVADEKKIDPPKDRHPGTKHKKTAYPPHFKIFAWGVSGGKTELSIWPSKTVRGEEDWRHDEGRQWGKIKVFDWSPEYHQFMTLAKQGKLDAALKIYGKHHPETLTWPVRFIHIPPIATEREVLK